MARNHDICTPDSQPESRGTQSLKRTLELHVLCFNGHSSVRIGAQLLPGDSRCRYPRMRTGNVPSLFQEPHHYKTCIATD